MQTKTFERTVRFREVEVNPGVRKSIPIVTVGLVQTDGNRIGLPLLFDTGASVTTLSHDLYQLLGLSSWDVGTPHGVVTGGGEAQAYRYDVTLEVFGKQIQCPVNLQVLPINPLFVGLFGREGVFREFGFGFWEGSKELYVTLRP